MCARPQRDIDVRVGGGKIENKCHSHRYTLLKVAKRFPLSGKSIEGMFNVFIFPEH